MLAKLVANPIVQTALATALTELSVKGPSALIELAVDHTAYKIAYHMVQLEQDMEPQLEKLKEKEEIKLCLVTT